MKLRTVAGKAYDASQAALTKAEPLLTKALFAGFRRKGEGSAHVLLAPPGGGSVGDQAMLEAYLRHVAGDVVVIVRRSSDVLRVPEFAASRTRVMALPDLLYGNTAKHAATLLKLRRLLADARSFSVIGADIMDGAYNTRASERRFRLASTAAVGRVDSRVLGFSWNAHPTVGARRAMQSVDARCQLIARDPASASRLRRDGGRTVRDAADLAFLVSTPEALPTELDAWCREESRAGRRIILLNANYLLEKRFDQVSTFRGIIDDAVADLSFVIVPNDSRGARSDAAIGSEIFEGVRNRDHVYVVDAPLTPGAVMTLADRAYGAISGRMHLTILCANAGTPAIAISYQGKIEGLYQRFGSSFHADPAETGFAEKLSSMLPAFLKETQSLSDRLVAGAAAMRELSLVNVAGLDERPPIDRND